MHLRPTVILRVIVLRSDNHPRLKKKSRSVSRRRMVAELIVAITEPESLRGYSGTSPYSDGRICAEAKWVNSCETIEHQQELLVHQHTTIGADRAVRTPVSPIAHDPRGNLVDLRVANRPETIAGERRSGKVRHSSCVNTPPRWVENSTWNS